MSSRTDSATSAAVLAACQSGKSNCAVGRMFNIDEATVRRIRARATTPAPLVYHDKKQSEFNWRTAITTVKELQKLRKSASWSQKTAKIEIGNGKKPIAVMLLSDTHIGAIGTDYDLFLKLTDLILDTPDLYVAILGDEVEWAVRLRSVAEICAQVLDPSLQLEFVEQWFEEILHKVIFATWSNHSTDRSEQMIGACPVKNILAKKVPYFSGIGHAELVVGKQTYKMAASHKFAGVTKADVTAGCKKYLREEYSDGEICVQGDAHRSGVSMYNQGDRSLVAVCSGTLNINSGYAARYFSLYTSTAFPVIQFHHDQHMIIPFYTIEHYLKAQGLKVAA